MLGERQAAVHGLILELAGVAFDAGGFSGSSLVPLWSGAGSGAQAQPVFSTALAPKFGEDLIAVTLAGKRYVRSLVTGDEQLYDLAADPDELRNVCDEQAAFAAEARRLLEQHAAEAEAQRARLGLGMRSHALDSRAESVLQSLGYL